MNEAKNDTQHHHGPRTDIRVPVIAIVGLVLSITGILFGQIQELSSSVEQRFSNQRNTCNNRWADFEKRLDGKADRSDADDRYTNTRAQERRVEVDRRLSDIKEANLDAHKSFRREIDHIHDMMRQSNECRNVP
jgi:hypothetical protein